MGSPVQASDILSFTKLVFKIYDAYRNVPFEAQEIRSKINDIGNELDSLSNTLADVGYKRIPQRVDRHTEIEAALSEAEAYLKTFTQLGPDSNVKDKLFKTAKYEFNHRRVQRMNRNLEEQRSKIRDIKIDVILRATLQKLETYNSSMLPEAMKPIDTEVLSVTNSIATSDSTLSADRVSLLSKAETGVRLARKLHDSSRNTLPMSRSPSSTRDELFTDQNHQDEAIQRFIEQIVSQAEASKLHLQKALADDHVEDFAKIADWLDRIQSAVSSSPPISSKFSSTPDPSLELPPPLFSPDEERNPTQPSSNDRGHTDSPPGDSDHRRTDRQMNDDQDIVPGSNSKQDTIDDAPVFDLFDGPDVTTELSTVDEVYVSNPYILEPWLRCSLAFSRSEATIYIWSTTVSNTPESSLIPGTQQAERTLVEPNREITVYRHVVAGTTISYPAILHPAADEENLIHFYQSQFIDQVDKQKPAGKTRNLRYKFKSKSDRNKVREVMYGKTLLATAGYDTVTGLRVCDIQSLSLWTDGHDRSTPKNASSSDILYITLPTNSQGSNAVPDQVVEYTVIGCSGLIKAQKIGEPVHLTLMPVLSLGADLGIYAAQDDRRRSFATASTASSTRSRLSFSSFPSLNIRRRSSDLKPKTCSIRLSDDKSQFREDKKLILKLLKERFPDAK